MQKFGKVHFRTNSGVVTFSSLQNRRYFFAFFRRGEQGQARGEREVRDTRDGRGAK